jgi:5-methylcytosine-specific restriction endonuclease McrA
VTEPHIPAVLRRQVRARAQDQCEYCLLPAGVGFFPQVDHVIATKHGGVAGDQSRLRLLALQSSQGH